MLGFLYIAWLYLRKLKPGFRHNRLGHAEMRRWRRYPIDLPVRVIVPNGDGHRKRFTPARGTAVSGGGMALYVDLPLKTDDEIEVEFETPSQLQVMGTVRSHTDHCFGLEFLTPL
jgi:hypothetical protein